MNKSKRINLHIYPSPLTNESRIEKEVRSLIDLRLVDEVIFIGYESKGKSKYELVCTNVTFLRINLFSKNSMFKPLRYLMFFEFFIKALWLSLRLKYDVINLHSLHVLPIAVFVKILRRKKVIYDAHELETEVSGSKGLIRVLSKTIEMVCIKFVDYVIVVSQSIADWYKKTYKINNISVIRNVPPKRKEQQPSDIFRQLFSIPKEHIIFIYQGLISKTRGVNIIFDTFKQLKHTNKHIVFLGDGPMKSEIQNLSQQTRNIHYHPMVDIDELQKYTSSADIGIHMILNTCLNHYYCLPNKIFEYFLYGLPVIVSDFPEMKMIVGQNKIGWCITPEIKNLTKNIEEIDHNTLISYKQNVMKSKDNYCWENEAVVYKDIYAKLYF